MLNLLLSKDWTAGRDEILRLISEDVQGARGGRILMVPELISHDMERRLCTAAGDTASRYAEVLSFTRLARRVAEQVGSAAQECLDNGGRIVAMAAATRQMHSKLKAYAAVETRPEFLAELVDAVDEFKRCCISAQDLSIAAHQTEGTLAQKLEELSLILEAYDSLCMQGKRDPRDQMTWLLEQLGDGEFAENHVFYIDGFPDFTRQHLAILEYLIKTAPDVTVSLTCDCVDSVHMAFEKAGDTARQLLECARRAGVKVNIRTVESKRNSLAPMRELLYQGHTRLIPELQNRLTLRRADSVYRECQGAAQRILELVRGGCRYRDIAVVCGDMAAYRNMLNLVFKRCGIPVYLSGTEDILSKSVIVTVLSAMDAALGGFGQQEVLRYLKSVLSPLDLDSCDALENYAILWGISGNRWLRTWENHPDGLGEQWTEGANKRLAWLNRLREEALAPLVRLRDGFRESTALKGQVTALYGFLEDIHLAKRLSVMAQEMDSRGDNRSAQILNQLWEILLTAMEQMYDILGETAWDAETFTRLFTLLLSQYDVGTIPPVLDSVVVGPVSAMRCQQVKHLVVLGAQEGALPGYGGAKGLLTDQERVALRELGVPLTGGNMEGLQAEFAEIYGVFCGADETVCVFCPSAQPSFVFRRLRELAGCDETYVPKEESLMTHPVEAGAFLSAYDAEAAAEQLGIREEYAEVCAKVDFDLGTVSAENIRSLYGDRLTLSASQVDKQADCRFAYFMRYGLRAKERKEATVDPAEFGTYVHAVLEDTARRVMELGGFHTVSLEDTLEIAHGYSDAYAQEHFSQIESQRVAYLLRRNVQELDMIVKELWQELHTSKFVPVDFELAFGEGADLPSIPINGVAMQAQLRGFVDRVDVWDSGFSKYFRVVDYKTGRKDFDYCDVYNGLGLQMLLYLFALEQGGSEALGDTPIPAGVQYFSARSPLITANGRMSEEQAEEERGKTWKRKGLILLDDAVLEAMEPEGSAHRLNCKRTKSGNVTGDVADREQLRMLKVYVFRLLGKMVDEIASGNVTANPYSRGSYHDACAFCPYGAVCHSATVPGRRSYKSMSAQRFWEEIGKEVDCHG